MLVNFFAETVLHIMQLVLDCSLAFLQQQAAMTDKMAAVNPQA